MAKRIVFLQLAPEFGSTKFGPFPGAEIRLGSDPGRNDIVLSEALGIAPEHARLVKQQDDTFLIAPVERTSQVWVWRADGRPAKQITAPMALQAGDGFSLVSAEGPRFIIVLEYPKPAVTAKDGPKGGLGKAAKKLSAGTLMEEIKRRGLATALTSSAGNFAASAWTFIRSGTFLQPRYIVLGMTIAAGWIFAGTMSCGAIGLAVDGQNKASALETCEERLKPYEGGASEVEGEDAYTLNNQTEVLLGDKDWKRALTEDADLRTDYVKALKYIKANGSKYEWIRKKSNPVTKMHDQLMGNNGFTPKMVRAFTYLAAPEGNDTEQLFHIGFDGAGVDNCYRGPALISWRMASRMEFGSIFLDSPMDSAVVQQGSREVAELALEGEATKIGQTVDLVEGDEISYDPVIQGGKQCAYVVGPDERDDANTILPNLKKFIGSKAAGLPAEPEPGWLTKRTLKFYAGDFTRGYEDLKFNGSDNVTITLDQPTVPKDAQEHARAQVAMFMAKAAYLPCLAIQGSDGKPADFLKEDAHATNSKITCAMFSFLIDEEK